MRVSTKYLLLGAGFGAMFPLVSTLVSVWSNGQGINLENLLLAQKSRQLLWVIDSAPLFLGFFAWMAGVRQERLEAFSRETSNDLEQLFRNSQDILCICAADSAILRTNLAFEKMLGQKPEAIRGKPLSQLVHPDDREQMKQKLAGIGESPGDLSLENRLVAADGSLNYVEWNISRPLQGKYLAIGRNVTLKRKHEEEITRNARSLERSLRELDQFAYVVSHDLKSPLRGIYSLADFIAEDLAEGNGPAVHEHLELLKRRVDRMQNLILGVLEYTRAGKDLEVRSPIVMATFLGQVGQGMKLPANFELNFPDQLPVVIFNPQKLRQILQNLISNSVRFNDKPQGRVDIDCIETPDSWEISVTDNGPGIEERFHEQVFSMFRTLQSRDDLEATGMGLPIVKKIVTEAGGSIHIDRGYAGGTRIVFSIVRN